MVSSLLTTQRLRHAAKGYSVRVRPGAQAVGSARPTPIFDTGSREIVELACEVADGATSPRVRLQRAHGEIGRLTRPVYGVDERQPASMTLRRGRGSCSQRLAILEAVARCGGIATRSRALLVDGSFWHQRFGRFAALVPDLVLVAWPEFQLEGGWVSASDLFPTPEGQRPSFTNTGADTLFDAIAVGAASWSPSSDDGIVCSPPEESLVRFLRCDLGIFESRDALFSEYGQNLPTPVRFVAGEVLGRWSAGAQRPRLHPLKTDVGRES